MTVSVLVYIVIQAVFLLCQICATLNSKFIIHEKLRMTLRGDVVCTNRGECTVELIASDKGDQLSQVWWEIHCQRVHGHE